MEIEKSMDKNIDKIKEITDKIISTLIEKGFVIQRYNSYTTNSVYLKLDYGVSNSIRISDHGGKKYLNYKYNIILDGKTERIMQKYYRYYFNPDDVDKMIGFILNEKEEKIAKYGADAYESFMRKNKSNHKGDEGFWKSSILISPYKEDNRRNKNDKK
jgi:hypothetical protein